jgi:hypothetical protein
VARGLQDGDHTASRKGGEIGGGEKKEEERKKDKASGETGKIEWSEGWFDQDFRGRETGEEARKLGMNLTLAY